MRGYYAVLLSWNPEFGGFYEPWQTGVGSYETREAAAQEAKEWAESEEIEYREVRP